MLEFIRATCSVPNKNVIQGMDLVYSQTKSGRPDINYWTKGLKLELPASLIRAIHDLDNLKIECF